MEPHVIQYRIKAFKVGFAVIKPLTFLLIRVMKFHTRIGNRQNYKFVNCSLLALDTWRTGRLLLSVNNCSQQYLHITFLRSQSQPTSTVQVPSLDLGHISTILSKTFRFLVHFLQENSGIEPWVISFHISSNILLTILLPFNAISINYSHLNLLSLNKSE